MAFYRADIADVPFLGAFTDCMSTFAATKTGLFGTTCTRMTHLSALPALLRIGIRLLPEQAIPTTGLLSEMVTMHGTRRASMALLIASVAHHFRALERLVSCLSTGKALLTRESSCAFGSPCNIPQPG